MTFQQADTMTASTAARRAFTLIEMVVVVMVMGILAGIAAPKYSEMLSTARLDTASKRVAADLRFARAEALRTSRPQTIEFDIVDQEYRFNRSADPDHPGQLYRVDLSGDPYYVELAAADFGGDALITFDAYGVPDSAGELRLRYNSARRAVLCDTLGATSYGAW